MNVQDRRQHDRVDDQLYFDYRIFQSDSYQSEHDLINELLGPDNQQYIETSEYFSDIEAEMKHLTQDIALNTPSIAHYLNLINAKVDFLLRQLLISKKIDLIPVSLSLGGISFRATHKISRHTRAKLLIYTKPKMIPIITNGICLHCHGQKDAHYQITMKFEHLDNHQEQLLSQHILLAQVRYRNGG